MDVLMARRPVTTMICSRSAFHSFSYFDARLLHKEPQCHVVSPGHDLTVRDLTILSARASFSRTAQAHISSRAKLQAIASSPHWTGLAHTMKTALIASLAFAVVCAVALYVASSARSGDEPLFSSLRRNLEEATVGTRRAYAMYPKPSSAPVPAPVRPPTMSPVMVTSAPIPAPVRPPTPAPVVTTNAPVVTTNAPVATTNAPVAAPTSSSQLPLQFIGNSGSPSSAFPLTRCRGDCDSDAECASGLTCFQRSISPGVPGCTGTPVQNVDYCVNPADLSMPGSIQGTSSETFRLKMYWQQGYFWQDLPTDPVFCMKCDDVTPGCFAGQNVFVAPCEANITTEEPTDFNFVFLPSGGAFYIKIETSNLCLTLPPNRIHLPLTVEPCSPYNELQLFFVYNGQATADSQFEIHPVTASDYCLDITHHPKIGERIFAWPCYYPRIWTTSLWNWHFGPK